MTPSDHLYGLSGVLWPIHLKPLPDELLSSWIIRLSHAHGYKVQTMCAILFGQQSSIWNRDIDNLAPQEIIDVLSRISGTPVERVEHTTLRSYEGTLFERHNANGVCRWIVPLGIFHRARRHPGLMFCPLCLREDVEPYFRRRWRLAFSIVCTKHQGYLLDACPDCGSPIEPHRSDMQGRQLLPSAGMYVHCWKCGFDLRKSHQTKVMDELLIVLQARMDTVLSDGYADWAGNPSMHSILFFDGLRELIAGVASKKTQTRLLRSSSITGINLSNWSRTGLELAPLPIRRQLFHLLSVILGDWPANFTTLIHECKLRYADLKGNTDQRVLWFENVIQREAGGGHTLIGRDEADAIARAVEAMHGHFRGDMARALSGHDINSYVPDRLPQSVSDEVYEDLLTSIDHQIARTLDKVERACLIRDKVMFAVGRQLGLSEGELAGLTLEHAHTLVPDVAELSFSDVARTPAQARAWVEWYWAKMRPQLMPIQEINFVFTSAKTRRGFRRSAIGLRFMTAVKAAMMQRKIRSYMCWPRQAESVFLKK